MDNPIHQKQPVVYIARHYYDACDSINLADHTKIILHQHFKLMSQTKKLVFISICPTLSFFSFLRTSYKKFLSV